MRFLADPPLVKLAKWLRILGYDAFYFRQTDPEILMGKARCEERIVLTRGIYLGERLASALLLHLFIQSDHLMEQLRQMDEARPLLASARLFTRCLTCNEELQQVPREVAEGRVPEFVYLTLEPFVECPFCHKVYWPGTHHCRMEERIRAWLEPEIQS